MNATQQWQSTEILKLFKNKTIQWISWYKCLEKSEDKKEGCKFISLSIVSLRTLMGPPGVRHDKNKEVFTVSWKPPDS